MSGHGLNHIAEMTLVGTQPKPIITEINADMSGTEDQEFIELYNPSQFPITLEGLQIQFINGSNSTVYKDVDLAQLMDLEWQAESFIVVGDENVRLHSVWGRLPCHGKVRAVSMISKMAELMTVNFSAAMKF